MSLSPLRLLATPWTGAYQAPLSPGFSRQEYWSGLPFPSPGDLPNPGIEPRSSTLQVDCLPLSHQRSSSPRVLIVVLFSSTISQNILTIPTEKEGHWKVIRKTGSILNSSSQFTPAFENLSGWRLVTSLRRPGFDPRVGKISWRRKWQPTPVLLPGKSHGRRSLVGCRLWGRTESDLTEAT